MASASVLARQLVSTLPSGIPGLFNPWADTCGEDLPGNDPASKIRRLAQHLDCEPMFILCGDAPGYQGCRHTGVAFTSERLLLEGAIPRMDRASGRLTSRRPPYSEPSATIVWRALREAGIEERVILWNAVQLHPHKPGNQRSNRTPTDSELTLGLPALKLLLEAFPSAQIVAVGKKASRQLAKLGIMVPSAVRHPANGGASEFAAGIRELVAAKPRKRI